MHTVHIYITPKIKIKKTFFFNGKKGLMQSKNLNYLCMT